MFQSETDQLLRVMSEIRDELIMLRKTLDNHATSTSDSMNSLESQLLSIERLLNRK